MKSSIDGGLGLGTVLIVVVGAVAGVFIANALLSISWQKIVVLLMINVLLLFPGVFMNVVSLLLILGPMLLPGLSELASTPFTSES